MRSTHAHIVPTPREGSAPLMESYLDIPRMLERMHRRFLDILQGQLTRAGITDLTPVQVFLLLDIGEDEISLQDLINRGHYLRSNALNNIKKLVESGHFEQSRATNDRRAVRLKLTPKALAACVSIRREQQNLAEALSRHDDVPEEMAVAQKALRRLERSWDEYLRYGTL
jgi:DNA-binding MarR family transcriptional regulator